MIRTVRARYADGALRPLEPLDLEEGAEVTVSVEEESPTGEACSEENAAAAFLERIARIRAAVPADAWDGMPTDFSKNKKHYLYGYPQEGE